MFLHQSLRCQFRRSKLRQIRRPLPFHLFSLLLLIRSSRHNQRHRGIRGARRRGTSSSNHRRANSPRRRSPLFPSRLINRSKEIHRRRNWFGSRSRSSRSRRNQLSPEEESQARSFKIEVKIIFPSNSLLPSLRLEIPSQIP